MPVPCPPPTLATERLTLRAMRLDDCAAFAAFFASPRAAHIDGGRGEVPAWCLFASDAVQWEMCGVGGLMIDLSDTGETVGQVSVLQVNAVTGRAHPEPELGWLLYAGHEGRGLATEAAGRLRDWAFAEGGVDRLVSYVSPRNARSIRVAERLGAVPDASAACPDPGDVVFRHHAPAGDVAARPPGADA